MSYAPIEVDPSEKLQRFAEDEDTEVGRGNDVIVRNDGVVAQKPDVILDKLDRLDFHCQRFQVQECHFFLFNRHDLVSEPIAKLEQTCKK
jgi:hypothetical protein